MKQFAARPALPCGQAQLGAGGCALMGGQAWGCLPNQHASQLVWIFEFGSVRIALRVFPDTIPSYQISSSVLIIYVSRQSKILFSSEEGAGEHECGCGLLGLAIIGDLRVGLS